MSNAGKRLVSDGRRDASGGRPAPIGPLAHAVGRTRFVVLLAVAAVMLVAMSLFVLASVQAMIGVWHAFRDALRGNLDSTELTIEFLEVVSTMLKAVVFYIVGVGFYSLFIAPLNLTAALGVDSFHELETKLVSVIIVIMSVTFLEHFIRWQNPVETLQFAAALGLVVVALVLFQVGGHRTHS